MDGMKLLRTGTAIALTAMAMPTIASAQGLLGNNSPALSFPTDGENPFIKLYEERTSARSIFSFPFETYGKTQALRALNIANFPDPNDGNVWPKTARYWLGDKLGVMISASEPARKIIVNNIQENAAGETEVSLEFRDGANQIVAPNNVVVYDLQLEPIRSELVGISEASYAIHYHFLVDRSGSMRSEIPTVINSVEDFAKSLPGNKQCYLYSFNDSFTAYRNPQPCDTIRRSFNYVDFGGGTDIYNGLISTFKDMAANAQAKKDDAFHLVIMITDGQQWTKHSVEDVKAAKTAPIFAYWTGNYSQKDLQGIADFEADASNGVKGVPMIEFLAEIGAAVNDQSILRFKSPKSASANTGTQASVTQ